MMIDDLDFGYQVPEAGDESLTQWMPVISAFIRRMVSHKHEGIDSSILSLTGTSGTYDHSELVNLDFESSGHTGFEVSGAASVVQDDLDVHKSLTGNLVHGLGTASVQDVDYFQEALVSGTNIKTINSNSLLGSGNVDIIASVSGGDHSTLANLDYIGSGHTGFQAELGFTPVNDIIEINGYPLTGDVTLDSDDIGAEPALGFTAVPNTRTINSIPLTGDVTLDSDDIGAEPALGFTAVPDTRTINSIPLTGDVTLDSDDIGAEPALGNPASNGYVLSSLTSGTRSWIELLGGGDVIAPTGGTTENKIPQWDSTSKTLKDGLTIAELLSAMGIFTYQTGDFKIQGHSTIPTGFLNCDGSAVSRTTYSALFAVIGETFGVGDGSTTFNIPDLRAATIRGVGTSTAFTQNVTVALAQVIDDMMQGHWHEQYYATLAVNGVSGPVLGAGSINNNYLGETANAIRSPKTDGTNGTPRTGNETTGKAIGLYILIKY